MGKKQREKKAHSKRKNIGLDERIIVKKRLSGSERKRLARAREKSDKLNARQGIYESLARCAASPEELEVLRANALAQRHSTAKRRARAMLLQERSGLMPKKSMNFLFSEEDDTKQDEIQVVRNEDRPLTLLKQKALSIVEGESVLARLWDSSLIPGRIQLVFADSSCDILTDHGYLLRAICKSNIFEFAPTSPIQEQEACMKIDNMITTKEEAAQTDNKKEATMKSFEKKSTAQSIMAELAALKARTTKSAIAEKKTNHVQEEEASIQTQVKYIPKPIELPSCLFAEHRLAMKAHSKELLTTKNESNIYRQVQRPADLQEARLELPVCGMEQEIVAAIRENQVLMLSGETGSGKSTQLPQFLYENGFGKVIIASPRRVACITTAKRVARELGVVEPKATPALVGYRTRYESGGVAKSQDGKEQDKPHLLFVTDGILLQQLRKDLLLREYEVVIIDEAHERGINTDLILGLLSRALPLRRQFALEENASNQISDTTQKKSLRLVIMSASPMTDVATSSELWREKAPTQLQIPGRRFSVQIHHALKSPGIHDYLQLVVEKTITIVQENISGGGILVFVTGRREVEWACKVLKERLAQHNLRILPLYAALKGDAQERAFVQTAQRLIVVATNVAETSVTIPGITIVVDSGRVKRRITQGGVTRFDIGWISQASAQQRAGRAGRVAPGHVYRLYSAAVFADTMPISEAPEVSTTPLEQFVIIAKSLGVKDLHRFPMVTPLPKSALTQAHMALSRLGAILEKTDAPLSNWGKKLARLPIGVRAATLLVSAWTQIQRGTAKKRLGGLALAAAAVLGERTPFIPVDAISGQSSCSLVPIAFRHARGDIHARVAALGAFCAARDRLKGEVGQWCREQSVDFATLERLEKLRYALARTARRCKCLLSVELKPSPRAELLLTNCILAASLDRVARLAAIDAVSHDKSRFERECAYELLLSEYSENGQSMNFAYLSRTSVLYARQRDKLPEYIVYCELARNDDDRLVIHGATRIDPNSLTQLAYHTRFLDLSDPLDDPPPRLRSKDMAILVRRKPKLQAAHSVWYLPSLSTVLHHQTNPQHFHLALARLLLDGSFFSDFQPSKRHIKLVADLLPFSFSVTDGPPTKLTKLIQLLTEYSSASDLRKALARDPRRFQSSLLRCLAILPEAQVTLYGKALHSLNSSSSSS